MKSLIRKNN